MSATLCPFEDRILRAMRLGRVDEDVRDHAIGCPECAELLEVAGLFGADRREGISGARPPAVGAVWFRMQLRARRESARRSSRAVSLIQAASLLAAAVGALALVGAPRVLGALAAVPQFALPLGGPVLYGMAAFALLAPLAVALALARR